MATELFEKFTKRVFIGTQYSLSITGLPGAYGHCIVPFSKPFAFGPVAPITTLYPIVPGEIEVSSCENPWCILEKLSDNRPALSRPATGFRIGTANLILSGPGVRRGGDRSVLFLSKSIVKTALSWLKRESGDITCLTNCGFYRNNDLSVFRTSTRDYFPGWHRRAKRVPKLRRKTNSV